MVLVSTQMWWMMCLLFWLAGDELGFRVTDPGLAGAFAVVFDMCYQRRIEKRGFGVPPLFKIDTLLLAHTNNIPFAPAVLAPPQTTPTHVWVGSGHVRLELESISCAPYSTSKNGGSECISTAWHSVPPGSREWTAVLGNASRGRNRGE